MPSSPPLPPSARDARLSPRWGLLGRRVLAGMGVVLAATWGGVMSARADSIAVDASTRFQTMTGWEVHARGWELDKISNGYDATWRTYCALVAQRMVNELGINRLQIPLRSGWANPVDYWTSFTNRQLTYAQLTSHWYETIRPGPYQFAEFDFYVETMLLPMQQQLAARGERLHVNLIVVDFASTFAGNVAFADNPAEYAAFVQAYFDRLKLKYGITPDALEIVNEPDNTKGWQGAQIGRALVAVDARLRAAGYGAVDYIAPGVTNAANTLPYLAGIATVPGAMELLRTVSYHRYLPGDYNAIRAFAQSRGLRTDMSEYFNATVNELIDDLTIAHVSSWQKWAIADRTGRSNPQAFHFNVDLSNPAAPVFAWAPNSALLAQFFRHVRMGAVRIAARSQDTGVVPVAFVNPDGSEVLVVKVAQGSGSRTVGITGLTPGIYGVRTTGYSGIARDLADSAVGADGNPGVTLTEGVTTLYGKVAPQAITRLLEYRHAGWNHYFVTGIAEEIAKLDNGTFTGWARTGREFGAYVAGGQYGVPVCRFFSTSFAPRSSHFYTAFAPECAEVQNSARWTLEGIVFNVGLPDADGTCAAGLLPVYRFFNDQQGSEPNHRFVTSEGDRAQMLAEGWTSEGYGPLGVAMCVPP